MAESWPFDTRGGGYSPTIPIWVCAAQWGRDFGTTDLERGIHFRARDIIFERTKV